MSIISLPKINEFCRKNILSIIEDIESTIDSRDIEDKTTCAGSIVRLKAAFYHRNNPLHTFLKEGNIADVELGFYSLNLIITWGNFSQDECESLLIKNIPPLGSTLSCLLSSETPDIVVKIKTYFSEMKSLMEKGLISQTKYKQLLMQINTHGLSPLHQAAYTGIKKTKQEEVFAIYIKELCCYCSDAEYIQLLQKQTPWGMTPIADILRFNDPEITHMFFIRFQHLLTNTTMTTSEMLSLLAPEYSTSHTPFSHAFVEAKIPGINIYLDFLEQLLAKGILSEDLFVQIITQHTRSATVFTLLFRESAESDVVTKENVRQISEKYLTVLTKTVANSSYSAEALMYYLATPDIFGVSPLSYILTYYPTETLTKYCEFIESLSSNVSKESLYKCYSEVLMYQGNRSCTNTLHQVLQTDDEDKKLAYIDFLQSIIDFIPYSLMKAMILSKDSHGLNSIQYATQSGKKVNDALELLIDIYDVLNSCDIKLPQKIRLRLGPSKPSTSTQSHRSTAMVPAFTATTGADPSGFQSQEPPSKKIRLTTS